MKICTCGAQARIIDSRIRKDHTSRRYSCPECGNRYSTIEVPVDDEGYSAAVNEAADRKVKGIIIKLQELIPGL